MKNKFASVLLILLSCYPAFGAEYDFYIDFDDCKNVVGYLVLSDESIKVMPGDPNLLACKRQSSTIFCDIFFKENQKVIKGNSEKYEIVIDSPPIFHFRSNTGAGYVAIDTNRRAVTSSARILHEKFLGAKVCQGIYATDFEMKHLDKK